MDGLQKLYLSKQNQKSVCIKYKNGTVERLKEGKAYDFVAQGSAVFCSKTEWKKQVRKQPDESSKKDEVVKEKKKSTKKSKK